MKRKIITIAILSIFLMTSLTSISVVAMNVSTNGSNTATVDVTVYKKGTDDEPIKRATVAVNNRWAFAHESDKTDEDGFCSITGNFAGGLYTSVNVYAAGYQTRGLSLGILQPNEHVEVTIELTSKSKEKVNLGEFPAFTRFNTLFKMFDLFELFK